MIATDRLQLARFVEDHADGDLDTATVSIRDTETTREWSMTVSRQNGELVFDRFDDESADAFERDALTAFCYALEELHERRLTPDLGPLAHPGQMATDAYAEGDLAAEFATVVEHDEATDEDDTDTDTDADTPSDAATEAPQPTAAVSDEGASPATDHEPDALGPVSTSDDHVDGARCGYCGRTFDSERGLAVHKGRNCRPDWLDDDPDVIIESSGVPRTLSEVIEAVVTQENVLQVSNRIAMRSAGKARSNLLGPLGLVDRGGSLLDGDELDERLSVLSGWADE